MTPIGPQDLSGSAQAPANRETSTPTSLDLAKRYGSELTPAWFYKRKMNVRCGPATSVYNQDPKAVDYPGVGYWQYPLWKSDAFASRDDAFSVIVARQKICKSCHCDDDDCYCHAELSQPTPTATGVSLPDYQRLLDSIPPVIKSQHKYYKWFHGLGEHGDFIAFSRDQPPFSNAQNGITGTKEPYSLEGPDRSRDSGWGSFAGLAAGYGMGGLGAAGSLLRRSFERLVAGADSLQPTNQTLNGTLSVAP
ncbi:hypothetical protein TWF696_003474 [Orbilia brochopaga]|uniref:Uncharacterized protein n=1 Tax=Orbilia brochopaga TaxID=3140254 RepID=A0AAV9TZL0_9PEZI